eukprot:s3252_g18.t1
MVRQRQKKGDALPSANVVGKAADKDKAMPEALKKSDLLNFVTLLLSSKEPSLRASCFRAISALSARRQRFCQVCFNCQDEPSAQETARARHEDDQVLPGWSARVVETENCTGIDQQGLPPQSLTFSIPSYCILHPPFAYSFWIYMQEPTSRGEFGRKTYFLMGHYMPAGTGTPVISVALAAGHGHSGQDGRLELWLGNDCKAPDNEEEVADGKTASELALVKAGVWMHALRQAATRSYSVVVSIQHRSVSAYLQDPGTWVCTDVDNVGEKVVEAKLQGRIQLSSLPPEPLRAVCFVGFPPPELLNYQSSISIMEGLIAHMTYHDEGLTRSQVYNAYFRSRHMLPTEKDILPLEEANERSESIMYPFHHQQPSPLMWLVISDKWHQVDTVLFAVLNSKTYLQRHGRDKGPQEMARSLRMAAIQLLMNIFDLEAVVPHRLRQYALNFSNMKSVTQTPFRLGISEDSFTLDFKLRFRGYALLEEGAKVQSIISCFAKKGSADRDQFRIALEATAAQSSEECMLAGEATGKPQAWHIVFCYNGQPTILPVPPMAGEWLHCAISYADGHTEMCCSWDGAPARKVEADYSKVDQRVSTDGYIGVEVTKKHIINNLLCDIHYFRAWKSSPGVEKVVSRYADADAPDPILSSGDNVYTMTVAACIHEDKGYILDLIPKDRLPGTKVSGRNFTMFPAVRARLAVTSDYTGAMLCSVHHAPRYVAPHPSLRLGLVQSQDVAARAAAEASEAGKAKAKPPSYTARVAAEKFESVQIRASVPDAAAKAGVPAGPIRYTEKWHEFNAADAHGRPRMLGVLAALLRAACVIHHSSDVNGQTKREQSWVGLLDEAGGDFYRFNCFDLEATADPRLMQQSPDGRLDHVVDKKKAMAKAALRRRGSTVALQVVMELQTRICEPLNEQRWVSVFINDTVGIIDARILRLQHRRKLRCAVFVGSPGQHFSSLPAEGGKCCVGLEQFHLSAFVAEEDRFSKFNFPMLVWPSFESNLQAPTPGDRTSVYACYAEMAESEAIPFEHPANDRARRRVLGRLAQPKLELSRQVVETATAGCMVERSTGLCGFPGDMLLLASLSAADELWKLIGKSGGDLGALQLQGSRNEVTQALEQKQVAMQVGGPLGFAKEVPAVKIHLLLVWHMFFSR